jgi:Bax protein
MLRSTKQARPRWGAARTSSKAFQCGMLGLAGVLVASLVGFAIAHPYQGATQAPRAILALPDTIEIETAARTEHGSASARPSRRGVASGHSAAQLWDTFLGLDYRWDEVQSGGTPVPRLRMARLPHDLADVSEIPRRKAIFFKAVLPLVLQANERIAADRERLWALRHRARMGGHILAQDRIWLMAQAERYGTEPADFDELLTRMDVVPPSLALAQSAEESGWGTSRFVREGNALFGQYTTASEGHLVPTRRPDDADFRVRAFANLLESVQAYMHNLNTHPAYARLRASRAAMRRMGAPLDGAALAPHLDRYSERGPAYVRSVLSIIEANGLDTLDQARLASDRRAGPIT